MFVLAAQWLLRLLYNNTYIGRKSLYTTVTAIYKEVINKIFNQLLSKHQKSEAATAGKLLGSYYLCGGNRDWSLHTHVLCILYILARRIHSPK